MDSLSPATLHGCFQATLAERKKCRSQCTVETCPLLLSYWSYRPNVPINAIFMSYSIILAAIVVTQGLRSKGFKMYTIVITTGIMMQILGYGMRIYAYYYPFSDVGFITQLSCLTLAPALFAAGIYFSLSRIISTFGEENSRLPPKKIPRMFIVCDFISLCVQAAGGAISAERAQQELLPTPGNNTLIGGLSFQSFVLLIFLGLAVDFGIRTRKRIRLYGRRSLNDDPYARELRKSKKFKMLLVTLTVAAILIFERSIYRIAELSEGWKGHLMSTESFVVIFEFVPVAFAGLLLALFHPGYCFRKQALPPKDGDVEGYPRLHLSILYDEAKAIKLGYGDVEIIEVIYERYSGSDWSTSDLRSDLKSERRSSRPPSRLSNLSWPALARLKSSSKLALDKL